VSRAVNRGVLAAVCAVVVACAAAPVASARVVRAEGILPPGQSGFVSLAGVTSGAGSPHLYDQQPLFIGFKRKPFMFNQPGTEERPRPDVRIVRDAYGVPAVYADSDEAIWWGAGYAVAQDRLFQLELFRRATKGRLAEVLGKDYLDDDLVARRDYYTQEERTIQLNKLPPKFVQRFSDYKEGVNAWIEHVRTSPNDLPGEFTALGIGVPSRWTTDDSAAIGIYLARTVPSGDGPELANLRALRSIGRSAFEKLLPLRVPGQLTTIPAGEGTFPSQPGRTAAQEKAAFSTSLKATASMPLPAEGAAATARTADDPLLGRFGRPLGSSMFAVRYPKGRGAVLFNGPQLGFSVPELFVELELHGPALNIRGVTAAGVPLVAIGHNADLAWGFTSGLSDEDDLYADSLSGDTGEKYRFNGAERSMSCRTETFVFSTPATDILGGTVPSVGSKDERVCRTVHGPVQVRAGSVAYARRYAVWGREVETLNGLAALETAKSVSDVDAAMKQVTWNENLMAADSKGNIGYWHPGLHPLRPLGFDERLPYPGTGEAEWRGFLDRGKQTPRVINPKQGWLANWNNVPSAGWTSGDAESSERLAGPYHRVGWLMQQVRRVAKRPSFPAAERAIRFAGSYAQQRGLATALLKKADTGASGNAKKIFDALLAWDGSYATVDGAGTVNPGVAIWEQFKTDAEAVALGRLGGKAAAPLAGGKGSSHAFDISNGQAFALRTLSVGRLRRAAGETFAALAKRFGTEDVSKWREPRRMYDVGAQGAGSAPPLPFFDRGTWEQFVELRP
jgi:penicillin amidase